MCCSRSRGASCPGPSLGELPFTVLGFLMWAHALGGPELLPTKRNARSQLLFPPRRMQRRDGGIGHRSVSGRKGSCPGGPEAARPSPEPALTLAARAFPMAEAIGGRCPRLERLEFGLLNRRPSFRAPDWVGSNFRSFSLRGKGLVGGPTGVAGKHTAPAAHPPCHVFGLCPSPCEDRGAPATQAGVALCPKKYELPAVDVGWHGLCKGSEQDLPRRTSWPN